MARTTVHNTTHKQTHNCHTVCSHNQLTDKILKVAMPNHSAIRCRGQQEAEQLVINLWVARNKIEQQAHLKQALNMALPLFRIRLVTAGLSLPNFLAIMSIRERLERNCGTLIPCMKSHLPRQQPTEVLLHAQTHRTGQ